jgi:hypothetical protein
MIAMKIPCGAQTYDTRFVRSVSNVTMPEMNEVDDFQLGWLEIGKCCPVS